MPHPLPHLDERALFERGPVVVFKWRNEAGWPVEYVSGNVHELLGYGADEFLSGTVSYGSLVIPEDLPRVGAEVTSATESGAESFEHEPYRVRRRDDQVIWLYDFTHILRDAQGSATHYLGYVFDVTSRVRAEAERHELELRLARSQKLESLGVLAGGVAHDFNNLLTGVLGHASLARRTLEERAGAGVEPADLARVATGLEQIEKLSLRAAELTQKLLAYAGMRPLVMAPVDLGALLADLASLLAVVITRRAKVVHDLASTLPCVMGDRAELQQVVMNLLTNASDALGDGEGTITLRTAARAVAEAEAEGLGLAPGQYVALEVSDTGCGMSEETKARIFEPFFTTKFAGRGLGMSAVLGIVRGHRGAITVASTPGDGARFTLLLPAVDLPEPPPVVDPPPSAWKGRGTVLIADDQRAICATLGVLLRTLGFETVAAPDGGAALELFRSHRDDIVLALLDMTMPVLSGVETLKALRDMKPTLPVILSTGFSLEDVGEQLSDQRVVFLQKPYRLADLEAALRAALEPPDASGAAPR
ncbi:MAG: response regulator [Myxococcales bacterium]|nr:response regulator [Myxococcales bacterium]